ncbi:MAG: DUF4922 domain-containing protein [Muribaculaceae bacterium]|nr:DUF4922 domain-containing protein [Muribaculaceae bacterium]
MINRLMELRDQQLGQWPLARENYEKLGLTERRQFRLGPLHGAFQCNPSRAISTGAKIDKASIAARPCFLCAANRPKEQLSEEILPGWEFLINPYPILPLHFTIASTDHRPQESIPLDMAGMAERLPGMTIFYNGAKAGASAPDHLHCQAVMTSELPLMNYLEDGGDPGLWPYSVEYAIITPDHEGMMNLKKMTELKGIDKTSGKPDADLVNAYFWIGKDGLLRIAVVLRCAHRPSCYPDLMVSPGAIDMAGIIVLPRKDDFDRISTQDIKQIFAETALSNKD